MPRLFALIFLVTGLTFSSMAFAQDHLPTVRPHDFDREVKQLAENLYHVQIEADEAMDFDAQGMVRIMIDETRIVDARIGTEQKRVILTGKQPGKAVVSLVFKDGTVSTFVINVKGDVCASRNSRANQ